MNGIIVIDKPENYTSFDVIAILRKKLNQKKIGHMGTLDPMATGVLPILLGSSAKFQIYTVDNKKQYIAQIKFGLTTDTWDIYGKTIKQEKNTNITLKKFKNTLNNFIGNIKQIPPMYSAIKINGVKLCNIARKGKEIERPKRDVYIEKIDILNFDYINQTAIIDVVCSKGTYIRSLCHEIGLNLNTGACMGKLKRTLSGSFSINNSINIEILKNMNIEKIKNNYILPTDCLFKENKSILINDTQVDMFRNGVNLSLKFIKLNFEARNNEIVKIYCQEKFIGIGKINIESNEICYLKCENQE